MEIDGWFIRSPQRKVVRRGGGLWGDGDALPVSSLSFHSPVSLSLSVSLCLLPFNTSTFPLSLPLSHRKMQLRANRIKMKIEQTDKQGVV